MPISRKRFMERVSIAGAGILLSQVFSDKSNFKEMNEQQFDVIIVGGSFSGFAAGLALGRALRKVLIIDSGKPCNRQTPYSHNFLTQDGKAPQEILNSARKQVSAYPAVSFFHGVAVKGIKNATGFEVHTVEGEVFSAKKLIFATGIHDMMPQIPGFAESWGISVLHCAYCHGYEVRNKITGIIGDGNYGFEFSSLISNWTKELPLYTNGQTALTPQQRSRLDQHNIKIVEDEIAALQHKDGYVQQILFKEREPATVLAIYTRTPFVQHCPIPEMISCEINEDGYIKVDANQQTTVQGVFACGDNSSRMRTVANAVSTGTVAGMMVNKELIEDFF